MRFSMRFSMRFFTFFAAPAAAFALAATAAFAAPPSPVGEWLVANGMARIKIEQCGKDMWGVISWEQTPGGRDSNNPDAARRDRPTLGLPILLGMKAASDRWEGQVYNARDGKTYDASVRLTRPDVLEIEGCVLGFLCGGEEWTRYAAPPHAAPAPGAKSADKPAASVVCASVAAATGLPPDTLGLPRVVQRRH
jgi:uncharacterized protein (DUF2147 family)